MLFLPMWGSSTRGLGARFFLLENALVEIAHDEARQSFVMREEPLADGIGILLRHGDRLFQRVFGAQPAIDEALDEADPILDDLGLLFQIGLAARLTMARH